jgi:hypothetical protein
MAFAIARCMIRERVNSGLARAKANSVRLGRELGVGTSFVQRVLSQMSITHTVRYTE